MGTGVFKPITLGTNPYASDLLSATTLTSFPPFFSRHYPPLLPFSKRKTATIPTGEANTWISYHYRLETHHNSTVALMPIIIAVATGNVVVHVVFASYRCNCGRRPLLPLSCYLLFHFLFLGITKWLLRSYADHRCFHCGSPPL